jgi:hypothetical protein
LVKNVNPDRLERIGELGDWSGYCKSTGTFKVKAIKEEHEAEIPFVLEVYADIADAHHITVLLNKSPVTGEINVYHSKNELSIFGCGLFHNIKTKPAILLINIMTPYIPIVTDGKEPDLSVIAAEITDGIKKTVNRTKKSLPDAPVKNKSQKVVVAACLGNSTARKASCRNTHECCRPNRKGTKC